MKRSYFASPHELSIRALDFATDAECVAYVEGNQCLAPLIRYRRCTALCVGYLCCLLLLFTRFLIDFAREQTPYKYLTKDF